LDRQPLKVPATSFSLYLGAIKLCWKFYEEFRPNV
jgi:hypothetical protein